MARTPLRKTQPPTEPRGSVEQERTETPQKPSRRDEPSRLREPAAKAVTPRERGGRAAGVDSRAHSSLAQASGEAATGRQLSPGVSLVTFHEVESSRVVVGDPGEIRREVHNKNLIGAFVWITPGQGIEAFEEFARTAESEARTAGARTVRVERPNQPRSVVEGEEAQEHDEVKVGLRDAVEAVLARVPDEKMRDGARTVIEAALAAEGV